MRLIHQDELSNLLSVRQAEKKEERLASERMQTDNYGSHWRCFRPLIHHKKQKIQAFEQLIEIYV